MQLQVQPGVVSGRKRIKGRAGESCPANARFVSVRRHSVVTGCRVRAQAEREGSFCAYVT